MTQLLLTKHEFIDPDLKIFILNAIERTNLENQCAATYNDIVRQIFYKTNKWSPESITRAVRKMAEVGEVHRFNEFSKRAAWLVSEWRD